MKLTKTERTQHDTHVAALREALDTLNQAISDYNEAVASAHTDLENAAADYNSAMQDAKSFAEDIANERRSKFDDRTEAWQESDRGQSAESFIDAWENFDGEEVEYDTPDTVDEVDDTAADDLENLPVTPDDC
jgi:chromosome segregation ATPase